MTGFLLLLKINEIQRALHRFSWAIIPMEIQLRKTSAGNSAFSLSWYVVTAAKSQELLMEQFCTAVNRNKSSEHASLYPVYNNQAYISKLAKYCSDLPWEWSKRINFPICLEIKLYSTSIIYCNVKSTQTLLLYLVGRWRQRIMARASVAATLFACFPCVLEKKLLTAVNYAWVSSQRN